MTGDERGSGGEVFRYQRGDDLRIYSLLVVDGGTEFWRVTVRPGQPDGRVKEEDFKCAETAARYFEETERTLAAGGWRQVSRFRL